MSAGRRILQVLADTDASPENLAALDLHGALVQAAAEVRTVALAPGRTGELASDVPVIAPARRTVAALAALRTEAKWADSVLFQGARALPPGVARLRSLPPLLLRIGADGSASGRSVARLAARGSLTLLTEVGAGFAGGTLPPGARHAVLPADGSAAAAAALVLAELERGAPPGAGP